MSLDALPNLDTLPDYLPYTALLGCCLVLAFLLVAAGLLLLGLARRQSRLQRHCDTLTLRYQRAEEQLRTVWQKEA